MGDPGRPGPEPGPAAGRPVGRGVEVPDGTGLAFSDPAPARFLSTCPGFSVPLRGRTPPTPPGGPAGYIRDAGPSDTSPKRKRGIFPRLRFGLVSNHAAASRTRRRLPLGFLARRVKTCASSSLARALHQGVPSSGATFARGSTAVRRPPGGTRTVLVAGPADN